MWRILENRNVKKTLRKTPKAILIKYEAWKRIVELDGPKGLKHIQGFRDESLTGNWKGFRSSRLSLQWRVIYKVVNNELQVFVFEVFIFKVTPMNTSDFKPARVNVSITPGEMLKTLRELQELTQNQLAEATGISQSNISSMETNTKNIGRDRALVLARALKVHPAVILFPDYEVDAA